MTVLDRNIGRLRGRFLDPRLIFIMDLLISVFVTSIVAVIAFLFDVEIVRLKAFVLIWGFASLLSSAVMFLLVGTHTVIIRHITFRDTAKFALAAVGKVVLMSAVSACFFDYTFDLLMMALIDCFFTFFALMVVRLVMIFVYDSYKKRIREIQKCTRVLVYGMSEKSVAAISRLSNSTHYNVVGIIADMKETKGVTFADKTVYYFSDKNDFEKIANELSLGGVLFADDDDAQGERDRLVQYCTDLSLKVFVVPTIDEFGSPNGDGFHVREVKIEDLLGRTEIVISLDEIKKNIADKVVMVTGAAGSIGSELCRQLAGFGVRKLVLYDNAETPMHNIRLELEERFPSLNFVPIIGDVRLERRLDFAFRSHRPQIVFHAAAYKHVPLMEENPCEAVLVNVAGTRNVANKCLEYGVDKMVMVSTDKAVNPTNIMGCTKRLAEIYVQSLGIAVAAGQVEGKTKFVTTRFGNVLGSNGSVIPRFREQIEKGGPVTVTHPDITRFFMTIPEACRLVMEAATLPIENRICVFDMGKPVKIDALARKMIELSGLVPDQDIKIVYSGLRPGEKLYEEVLSNVENTDPTSHDRIRIARVRMYDYNEAVKFVDRLEFLSREVNIPDMVKLMKEIVPEYISNNSRYQEYDRR